MRAEHQLTTAKKRTIVPPSLRWWLPLSYAGIALLATLSLGAILLTILLVYYQAREQEYLDSNAQAVSARLAPLVANHAAPAVLQAEAQGFAFLLQSRVRILDTDRRVLVDSGLPSELTIDLSTRQSLESVAEGGATADSGIYQAQIVVKPRPGEEVPVAEPDVLVQPTPPAAPVPPVPPAHSPGEEIRKYEEKFRQYEAQFKEYEARVREYAAALVKWSETRDRVSHVPVANTLYGFNLGPEVATAGPRSSRIGVAPLNAPETDQPLGYVELADGPFYGGEIVLRVGLTWVLASGLATLLAAIAGWRVSQRMTAPLITLAGITTRMAAGDLSARAIVRRRDEIGLLAHSFNEMASRIEEVIFTLRRFVADAAHELNTPLTALRANLDLAIEDPSDDERSTFVALARADVERLEQLASDLLDLSQVEAATDTQQHVPIDLVALARALSESYSAQAEQSGVAFTLDVPEERMTIRANEPQVRQALGNLLANAIKFTPPGGTVSLEVWGDVACVEVRVTDTGIGIPADDLPHLFSRFHRGRNAAAYPGSGLGLAIVKAIMARHGGRASASNTSSGACFSLIFPI
jgi:signal transduction histidine kinase